MTPGVRPDELRHALRRLAGGVCAICTTGPAGPVGMAATAVASLSLVPPMVTVGLNAISTTAKQVASEQRFTIGILAAGQDLVAAALAQRNSATKFDSFSWSLSPSGLPVISGVLATLECTQVAAHAYGDHVLVVALVTSVSASEDPVDPLVYVDGAYRQLQCPRHS